MIILLSMLPIILKLLSNERIPNSRDENIFSQYGMMNKHWTRPKEEECPDGHKKVEGSCYW